MTGYAGFGLDLVAKAVVQIARRMDQCEFHAGGRFHPSLGQVVEFRPPILSGQGWVEV